MSDDYLAKSGARDLLTAAIAELLAVRPRMPLSFLAAHLFSTFTTVIVSTNLISFQDSSNKVAATAHILRASHLRSKTSFQDSVMKAYQILGTPSIQDAGKQPDSGSGLKALSSSVGASAAAFSPAAVIRSAKPTSGGDAQQRTTGKTFLSGATLSRRDFVKLLEYLCEEFPKHLQQRTFDALQQQQQQPQNSSGSSTVSLAEFQRGVEVCLLLEELVDVVEDLFRSIDKSEAGEVRASAFLLALEMAAATSTQDSHRNSLLAVLKVFVLPSPPRNSVADSEGTAGSTTTMMPMPTAELYNDRALRLSDMYDAIFHLVFQP